MKLKYGLLFFAAALLTGCNSATEEITDRVFLLTGNTSKSWTTLSIQAEDRPEGVNCLEDDEITFTLFNEELKEPRFKITDGYFRCFDSDEYIVNEGSWRLNNERTRIILTYGSGQSRYNQLFDILEITPDKLVLRKRTEEYNSLVVTTEIITYESR